MEKVSHPRASATQKNLVPPLIRSLPAGWQVQVYCRLPFLFRKLERAIVAAAQREQDLLTGLERSQGAPFGDSQAATAASAVA
jgi:hypothetical protein